MKGGSTRRELRVQWVEVDNKRVNQKYKFQIVISPAKNIKFENRIKSIQNTSLYQMVREDLCGKTASELKFK